MRSLCYRASCVLYMWVMTLWAGSMKEEITKYLENFWDPIQCNTYIFSFLVLWCMELCKVHDPKEPPPEKRKDTISWKHLISSTLNKKHFKFTPCVTVHQIIKWYVGYAPFERHWLFRTGNNHNVYYSCVKFDLSG